MTGLKHIRVIECADCGKKWEYEVGNVKSEAYANGNSDKHECKAMVKRNRRG